MILKEINMSFFYTDVIFVSKWEFSVFFFPLNKNFQLEKHIPPLMFANSFWCMRDESQSVNF